MPCMGRYVRLSRDCPPLVNQRFCLQSIPAPLILIDPEQRAPYNVSPCVCIINALPCPRQGGNCDLATSLAPLAQATTPGSRYARIDRNSYHHHSFIPHVEFLIASNSQLHRLRRIIL